MNKLIFPLLVIIVIGAAFFLFSESDVKDGVLTPSVSGDVVGMKEEHGIGHLVESNKQINENGGELTVLPVNVDKGTLSRLNDEVVDTQQSQETKKDSNISVAKGIDVNYLQSSEFAQLKKEHPHRASVIEAVKSGKYPERLSVQVPALPFDQSEYIRDPEAYVSRVEPARVFQSAGPAQGVAEIESVGSYPSELTQGTPLVLRVKADPSGPVSFHTFGGGYFEASGLSSISVRTDKNGYATVSYMPTAAVVGSTTIWAASPILADHVEFELNVSTGSARSVEKN